MTFGGEKFDPLHSTGSRMCQSHVRFIREGPYLKNVTSGFFCFFVFCWMFFVDAFHTQRFLRKPTGSFVLSEATTSEVFC